MLVGCSYPPNKTRKIYSEGNSDRSPPIKGCTRQFERFIDKKGVIYGKCLGNKDGYWLSP
ncbi:MAG: hypothetical protein MUD14_10980 [Hydrococcus sp. Prado102]|nr:hypothetical protein [Hydrococcus sp. Prado102]